MTLLERAPTIAFVAIGAVLLTLAAWALGSALRRNHRVRRNVQGLDGVWSTRIHWAHPDINLGVAKMVFDRSFSDPTKEAKAKHEERKKNKKNGSKRFDVADLFFGVDEGALVVAGLLAVFGLTVAAVVFVLLAVELAVFLLLFGLLGAGRAILGHPWTIEVVNPSDMHQHYQVVGFGEARQAQRELNERIEAGALVLDTV